jgi:DNA-binding transcriptional LysR family regulator
MFPRVYVHNRCMIDLRRVQVLRAVHQHGTVTAAAAALHLTPSAVSHHLRELSRELKVRLIEPQGRRIRLTGAAHVVIEHGDAMVARWERAEAALESYRAGTAGLLRMCGFPSAVAALIAPAAALLRAANPELTVEVSECETPTGFDLLLATDADIAVLAPSEDFPHPGDARFDQRTLLDEPLDLLVPAGHPLVRRTRGGTQGVRLEDTAREEWILAPPGSCDHHQRVVVFCAVAGFTPKVAHYVRDWMAISAMVGAGLGVSLVPRMAPTPPEHAVVRLPLTGEPALTRRILTCVREGSRDHPLIQHGLKALAEAAAAVPGRGGITPPG